MSDLMVPEEDLFKLEAELDRMTNYYEKTKALLDSANKSIAELEAAQKHDHVWTNEFGLKPYHCIYCGIAIKGDDDE